MKQIGLTILLNETDHPAPRVHPERPEKLRDLLPALDSEELSQHFVTIPEREYDLSVLERVHTHEQITRLAEFAGPGLCYHDTDTFQGAASFVASCRVTWALLSAVEQAFAKAPPISLVLGRPPGHHAESNRVMGFCLVNHVAVAAQFALDQLGAQRVAVVDFDVHHGNGTQEIFYERNDVLYVSTHQHPLYPGSGLSEEKGRGNGEGFTLNYPKPAGADDDSLIGLFECSIKPEISSYDPDLILVSAGFDGHVADPLAGWQLTGVGYRQMASILKEIATTCCEGRLVSLLEGGYDPQGNRDAITNYLEGLLS